MNAKAASAIRFAIALAVKEQFVFNTTERFPITAHSASMLDSDRWITQSVPKKYQDVARRALWRSRHKLMGQYTQKLLTGAKQAYYDIYNEHYDREN